MGSGPTCKVEIDQKVLHEFICKVTAHVRGYPDMVSTRTDAEALFVPKD